MVGLGNFAHCIAASGRSLTAVLTGQTRWTTYLWWLGLAVAGNICGGVGMVTLLEYGQVVYGDLGEPTLREDPSGAAKAEENAA